MSGDLISRDALVEDLFSLTVTATGLRAGKSFLHQCLTEYKRGVLRIVHEAPTISPDSLRPKGLYTAHEVAEIIAELLGSCYACDFNGIDEWLPTKCGCDVCPNPAGVACWEQYLKYREERSEHG